MGAVGMIQKMTISFGKIYEARAVMEIASPPGHSPFPISFQFAWSYAWRRGKGTPSFVPA